MAQPSVTTTIETSLGDVVIESVNPANLNRLWGDLVDEIAQAGAMGEHSREAGFFTPDAGDGGRRGVGNVTQEDFAPLPDGGQGIHATVNAALLGSDALPPDIIEAQIGPFFPESIGNLTVISSPETTQMVQAIAAFDPSSGSVDAATPFVEPQPALDLAIPHG